MWVAILNGVTYITSGQILNGGQPPWGSEVPLIYQAAEKFSHVGAGYLVTKSDTCVWLPTSQECGTQKKAPVFDFCHILACERPRKGLQALSPKAEGKARSRF